ncbi:hypothetical protein X011_06560 [Mycobacterium tuberculosis variant microti OV254]|nr:hypothetical protein X011_06560 [Mycobacterium tuberculosis variant microti OV254]
MPGVGTSDRVCLALANPVRREPLKILTLQQLSAGELSDSSNSVAPWFAEDFEVLRDAGPPAPGRPRSTVGLT